MFVLAARENSVFEASRDLPIFRSSYGRCAGRLMYLTTDATFAPEAALDRLF